MVLGTLSQRPSCPCQSGWPQPLGLDQYGPHGRSSTKLPWPVYTGIFLGHVRYALCQSTPSHFPVAVGTYLALDRGERRLSLALDIVL